jgi:putative MATE family efflux protein
MVGNIAVTILNITDTAFLGRVGEAELGASAVGGVLYLCFAMIGISIGTGAQIMIARRTGEKNDKSVGEIFDHSLFILVLLGLFLFGILRWFAPVLMRMILNSNELVEKTTAFLTYRSYGLIFVTAASAFRSFYVGIAQPKIFGIYSFLMASVNIFLGYGMIFGHFGFRPMGIAGAGAASSISEFVALLFVLIFTLRRKIIDRYNLFHVHRLNSGMIKRLMNLSLPLVVQNLISMGAWFVFFVFIEKFGQHELAISNIIRAAYITSMTPIWGFSVAANTMVSNIIGQNKPEEVFILLRRIMKLTLAITVCISLINLLFPSLVLGIFTSDLQLIHDARNSLLIVAIAMLFFSVSIIAISTVSGTGATRTALYIEIAAILLYMIYNSIFTYLIPINVEILWLSEIIYWLFTGAASYWYISSMKWLKYRV